MYEQTTDSFAATSNPWFLLLGAVSLLIVLVTLYRGAWKDVVKVAVGLLYLGFVGLILWGSLLCLGMFAQALFGPEEGRASSFTIGVILAAAVIVISYILSHNNALTRFMRNPTGE